MKATAQIGVIFGLLAVPVASFAAEHNPVPLVPLDQIVQDGAPKSVLALHCAGLFHSVWDFIGEDTLGPTATEQAKSNATLFIDAGTRLRAAETGATQSDVSQEVIAEAFAVSTQYYNRYAQNVTDGGDAYASDEVWNSDLKICRNLAAQL